MRIPLVWIAAKGARESLLHTRNLVETARDRPSDQVRVGAEWIEPPRTCEVSNRSRRIRTPFGTRALGELGPGEREDEGAGDCNATNSRDNIRDTSADQSARRIGACHERVSSVETSGHREPRKSRSSERRKLPEPI